MTDAAYTFKQTVSERKQAGTGAHHKVTHKYTGVKLPSDYLTVKERNALNGELVSVNLNRPIKFAEFRKLSNDMKKEYMESLIRRFSVPKNHISQMMGVSYWSLYTLLKEANIEIKPAQNVKSWDEEGWNAWLNGANYRSEGFVSYTHEQAPETRKVSVKKTVTKTPKTKSNVQSKTESAAAKSEDQVLPEVSEQETMSATVTSIEKANDISFSSEQIRKLEVKSEPKTDDTVVLIEKRKDDQVDYAGLFNALLQSGKKAHVTITFDI